LLQIAVWVATNGLSSLFLERQPYNSVRIRVGINPGFGGTQDADCRPSAFQHVLEKKEGGTRGLAPPATHWFWIGSNAEYDSLLTRI